MLIWKHTALHGAEQCRVYKSKVYCWALYQCEWATQCLHSWLAATDKCIQACSASRAMREENQHPSKSSDMEWQKEADAQQPNIESVLQCLWMITCEDNIHCCVFMSHYTHWVGHISFQGVITSARKVTHETAENSPIVGNKWRGINKPSESITGSSA